MQFKTHRHKARSQFSLLHFLTKTMHVQLHTGHRSRRRGTRESRRSRAAATGGGGCPGGRHAPCKQHEGCQMAGAHMQPHKACTHRQR